MHLLFPSPGFPCPYPHLHPMCPLFPRAFTPVQFQMPLPYYLVWFHRVFRQSLFCLSWFWLFLLLIWTSISLLPLVESVCLFGQPFRFWPCLCLPCKLTSLHNYQCNPWQNSLAKHKPSWPWVTAQWAKLSSWCSWVGRSCPQWNKSTTSRITGTCTVVRTQCCHFPSSKRLGSPVIHFQVDLHS